jgi:shikimate kinase/3-dehydroquinate synthase
MMGAGKSTVGRRLAKRLGREFVDADAYLEAVVGRSIADIFRTDGEAVFRAREREVVAALAGGEPSLVIALGGGAVLDDASRRVVRGAGAVVWLQASVEELVERTSGCADRPLVADLGAEARSERFTELLSAREPVYAESAHLVVDTTGRSPEAVASEVAARLAGPRTVRVELGADGYDIAIEAGGLDRLGEHVTGAGFRPGPCVVVTCERVAVLYGERCMRALASSGYRPQLATLPRGEAAKRLEVLQGLCRTFAEHGLDRTTPVIAVGGGALTDVAGFAAAVYRRGIPWVACPTTLLGMVDAAIGGKTAVNLDRTKNLVGAFHQPRLVLADPFCLATLEGVELRSGLGEVLKYALIGPGQVWDLVGRGLGGIFGEDDRFGGDLELACALVGHCAQAKAAVVSADEREMGGGRKVLNFGHTVGHAIEATLASGEISHGEAVILGMRAALFLSQREGLITGEERARLEDVLDRVPVLPLRDDLPRERLLAHLRLDKKSERGRVRFVLLEGRGRPRIDVEVSEDAVVEAIDVVRRWG